MERRAGCARELSDHERTYLKRWLDHRAYYRLHLTGLSTDNPDQRIALIGLNFNQQRYEADFRYSLVRLRENTESVAFYRGEDREFDVSSGRFRHVVENFSAIMWRSLKVNGFTFSFGQASVLFPYLVQAPRFFARQIKLGDLQQTGNAFNQVVESLSFIINAFGDIAMWFAVVRRLSTFDAHVAEIVSEPQASRTLPIARQGTGLAVSDLALDLPDGRPLISNIELSA